MPAKPKLLNVREHLKAEVNLIDFMIREHHRSNNPPGFQGTYIAPVVLEALQSQRFIALRILAKHESKKTRKDIYIEAPTP